MSKKWKKLPEDHPDYLTFDQFKLWYLESGFYRGPERDDDDYLKEMWQMTNIDDQTN